MPLLPSEAKNWLQGLLKIWIKLNLRWYSYLYIAVCFLNLMLSEYVYWRCNVSVENCIISYAQVIPWFIGWLFNDCLGEAFDPPSRNIIEMQIKDYQTMQFAVQLFVLEKQLFSNMTTFLNFEADSDYFTLTISK